MYTRHLPTTSLVLLHLGALVACASAAAPARAAEPDDTFFFYGQVAPRASLAGTGIAEPVVYLWWDAASGALPHDLASFRVRRDGALVATLDARTFEDATAIRTAYAQPWQARRRAEAWQVLCNLDVTTTVGSGPRCGAASATTVANRTLLWLQRLAGDPAAGAITPEQAHKASLWASLATRRDPVLAWARHRGLTEPVPPGATTLTYDLEAVDTSGTQVASLGHITLDVAPVPLPGPEALRQPTLVERGLTCDAPDSGKAHGTVALAWDVAGASVSPIARYQSEATSVGFDVWRQVAPIGAGDACPARDLAAAVAAGGFDATTGVPRAAGLVRASATPVRPGGGGGDPTVWLETADAVAALGYRPGDALCYYVAARDLSGNYGATGVARVIVPDIAPPPSPADVAGVAVSEAVVAAPTPDPDDPGQVTSADRFELQWSHLDARGWVADHDDGRAFCNLATAAAERRVVFADTPDGCARGATRTVNLDIIKYLVYRVDDPDDASFADADADGVPDADDGAPCDAAIGGSSSVALVAVVPEGAFAAAPQDTRGRRVLSAVDAAPVGAKGQAFWYRVVAVSRAGIASEPSPPVRASFPDEVRPARPTGVTVTRCGQDAFVEPRDPASDPVALDLTCRAERVRFTCALPDFTLPDPHTPPDPRAPTLTDLGGAVILDKRLDRSGCEPAPGKQTPAGAIGLDASECLALQVAMAERCVLRAELVGDRGQRLAAVELAGGDEADPIEGWVADACAFAVVQAPACDPGVPIADGEVVDVPVTIDVGPALASGQCADLSEEVVVGETRATIDGSVVTSPVTQTFRVATLCKDLPGYLTTFTALPGEDGLRCMHVSAHNASNVVGTALALPCFRATSPGSVPEPPRLVSLQFDPATTGASLAWTAAPGPGAGILAEWQQKSGTGFQSRFFARDPATTEQLTPFALGPDAPATPGGELWCLRARTIDAGPADALGASLSEWTTPLCAPRDAPNAPQRAWIPWPTPELPPAGPPLAARYVASDQTLVVPLASVPAPTPQACRLDTEDDDCGSGGHCAIAASGDGFCAVPPVCDASTTEPCFEGAWLSSRAEGWCEAVAAAFAPLSGVVVYRQERVAADAEPGPWIQVSALIDAPTCYDRCFGLQPGTCDGPAVDRFVDLDLAIVRFADAPATWQLAFPDRYPFRVGRHYRYTFAFFDVDGELAKTSVTAWTQAVGAHP